MNKKVTRVIVVMILFVLFLNLNVGYVSAYKIETIGSGDFLAPINNVPYNEKGYEEFHEKYISKYKFDSLANHEWKNGTSFVEIASLKEFSDLYADTLYKNKLSLKVKQTIDLAKKGYSFNDETKILKIDKKNYNLNNYNELASIPSDILYTNKKIGELLTSYGKKERGIYYDYRSLYTWEYKNNQLIFYYLYIPTQAESLAEIDARNQFIDKLIETVKTTMPNATELEKAYYLYSYLSRFVTYDKTSNLSPYSPSSVAIEYKAVCQAIAYVYQAAGEKLGLKMHYVTGYTESGYHAWNLIQINGKWYHTDATWGIYKYQDKNKRDMSESYVVYNQHFLFTLGKNKRTLDKSVVELMNREKIVVNDKKFDSFVNYTALGGGIYKNKLITYKENNVLFFDLKTNKTIKSISFNKKDYTIQKAAVINNEYYQVYKHNKNNKVYIQKTDLNTLKQSDFKTVNDSKMISFVDKGILIQNTKTKKESIIPYSSSQEKAKNDKLFLVKLNKEKFYYTSDKYFVDSNLNNNAINERLANIKFVNTKSIKETNNIAYLK